MRQIRSRLILKAARGEQCTMQTPACNEDPETTIAAHSNWQMHGKGAGQKADDLFVAFACSNCHHWLDTSGAPQQDRLWYWARGHARTLRRLIELGHIKIGDFLP